MLDVREPGPGRPYALVAPQGDPRPEAIDRDAVRALYRRHGALLFRGFDFDVSAFADFATGFCSTSVLNESRQRDLLDPATNIQSVNLGTLPFALHPELSREPWKPDCAFFCCLVPPVSGGETLICDGVALADALPPDIRSQFAASRLLYARVAAPEVLAYWLGTADPDDAAMANVPAGCPYSFHRTEDGRVVRAFTRPALHKPMFDDRLAFGNFLLFARYSLRRTDHPRLIDGRPVPAQWVEAAKAAGDQLSAPVRWERGDLLMLDNTRFLHGRNAVIDADERRIASYFGYLDFAIPDTEEPADAIWRRENFRSPEPARQDADAAA